MPSGSLAPTTGRMIMSHTETGNTGTRPGVNGGGQVSISCSPASDKISLFPFFTARFLSLPFCGS